MLHEGGPGETPWRTLAGPDDCSHAAIACRQHIGRKIDLQY